MKQIPLLVLWVLLQVTIANSSRGQSFSVPWHSIDGGGGISAGGVFTLAGTIGQPDAGVMTGGGFGLTGGFWSFVGIVQTEGAPILSIALTSPNSVQVSWPAPATGFLLEQNPSVASTNWTSVGTPPSDNGTMRSVVLPAPPGQWFYRLRKH